jgi:hypothetical protein
MLVKFCLGHLLRSREMDDRNGVVQIALTTYVFGKFVGRNWLSSVVLVEQMLRSATAVMYDPPLGWQIV